MPTPPAVIRQRLGRREQAVAIQNITVPHIPGLDRVLIICEIEHADGF
jgi:hypothetical protein